MSQFGKKGEIKFFVANWSQLGEKTTANSLFKIKQQSCKIYEEVLRKKIPADDLPYKENKYAETETH
jgi:hypothetical protein